MKLHTIIRALMASSLLIIAAAISACAPAESTQSFSLEYAGATAQGVSAGAPKPAFDEKSSFVVRCVSVTRDATGLTISATKSRSADIKTLLFIDLMAAQDSAAAAVRVAGVPVSGDEAKYDISQAAFYTISLDSARNAASLMGLTYDNWLMGALNPGELFPCCSG